MKLTPPRVIPASISRGRAPTTKSTAWHEQTREHVFCTWADHKKKKKTRDAAEPHTPSSFIQIYLSDKSYLFPWTWISAKFRRKKKAMTLVETLPHEKQTSGMETIRFLALKYFFRYKYCVLLGGLSTASFLSVYFYCFTYTKLTLNLQDDRTQKFRRIIFQWVKSWQLESEKWVGHRHSFLFPILRLLCNIVSPCQFFGEEIHIEP